MPTVDCSFGVCSNSIHNTSIKFATCTMSSIDTSTSSCASCGKEGGNLNTCNKCKMVKYCNAACKKKHRSKHKKQCERRVAELHDEALFKEPPPNDECPICFLPLPLDIKQAAFKPCCGKVICTGCIYAMNEALGRGKIYLCAFCRKPSGSSEECVEQMKQLMESGNAVALWRLAGLYKTGEMGVQQDLTKANELFLRAGELGYSKAYFNLGNSYDYGRGVDVDSKKAKYYYELAAMSGDIGARLSLGFEEFDAGNITRAMKHFILAAKAGSKMSLDAVKIGFMKGFITKDEYANTLRAYQQRHDEMKSDDRDKASSLGV